MSTKTDPHYVWTGLKLQSRGDLQLRNRGKLYYVFFKLEASGNTKFTITRTWKDASRRHISFDEWVAIAADSRRDALKRFERAMDQWRDCDMGGPSPPPFYNWPKDQLTNYTTTDK